MRVEIKTKEIVRDRDVRALHLINFALEHCTPRMIEHNLSFIADKYGYRVEPKYDIPMSMRIR
jgi:hypothetical protein